MLPTDRILVIDDEPANTVLLEALLLRWGYEDVLVTNDSSKAIPLCESFQPDIVLLDLHMPDPDGFEIMCRLPEIATEVWVPVLVLTADASRHTKRDALASGAHDYVTKPFDADEVKLRVSNLLRTRHLELEAYEHHVYLKARVAERTKELEEARHETLVKLAIASEFRDDAVGDHIFRVSRTTGLLAERIDLEPPVVSLMREAATLHDVGKIGVPDAILLKPGPLDDSEWQTMRAHTHVGARILGETRSQVLAAAAEICLTHHERWDGSGYPAGLFADSIPLAGLIVAIADVFDALTHSRPYKEAWPIERAVEEIKGQSGRAFDPELVDGFMGLDHGYLASAVTPEDRLWQSETENGRARPTQTAPTGPSPTSAG